jgi:hypothetical protein
VLTIRQARDERFGQSGALAEPPKERLRGLRAGFNAPSIAHWPPTEPQPDRGNGDPNEVEDTSKHEPTDRIVRAPDRDVQSEPVGWCTG